jgi:hypothetical protein
LLNDTPSFAVDREGSKAILEYPRRNRQKVDVVTILDTPKEDAQFFARGED